MPGRPTGAQWHEKRALMANLPPRLIQYLYHDMMMSTREIAALLDVGDETVFYFMKRNGIVLRDATEATHVRKAKNRQSKRLDELKKIKMHRGYEQVYMPEHPRADNSGKVYVHIVAAEQKIGRPLKPDEVVHHINGIKNDNRPENLQVMTDHEHRSYHIRQAWKRRKAAMAEQHRQEAYDGS